MSELSTTMILLQVVDLIIIHTRLTNLLGWKEKKAANVFCFFYYGTLYTFMLQTQHSGRERVWHWCLFMACMYFRRPRRRDLEVVHCKSPPNIITKITVHFNFFNVCRQLYHRVELQDRKDTDNRWSMKSALNLTSMFRFYFKMQLKIIYK